MRQHARYGLRMLGLTTIIGSFVINTVATKTFYYHVAHRLTAWAYLPVSPPLPLLPLDLGLTPL